ALTACHTAGDALPTAGTSATKPKWAPAAALRICSTLLTAPVALPRAATSRSNVLTPSAFRSRRRAGESCPRDDCVTSTPRTGAPAFGAADATAGNNPSRQRQIAYLYERRGRTPRRNPTRPLGACVRARAWRRAFVGAAPITAPNP